MLPLNDMLVAGISFMVDPKCSQTPYAKESYSNMALVVGRFKFLQALFALLHGRHDIDQ